MECDYGLFSKQHGIFFGFQIDPIQKWLPSNYSFVCFQNSLTNLVLKIKIQEFVTPNEVSEAILNTNKRII